MSRPDDGLDPIVERAETLEEWVGIKQADNEDREFDMTERLDALKSAIAQLAAASKRDAEFHGSEEHRATIHTNSGLSECLAYEEMYAEYARTLTELLDEVAA